MSTQSKMFVPPDILRGDGGIYIALGSTMAGKTFLVRELIKHYGGNFDTHTIMSGTSFSRDWDELRGINVSTMTIEKIERLVNMAEEEIKVTGRPGRHLLVLDDAMSALTSTRSDIFKKISTAGRHYGVTVIMMIQHYKFVVPTIRTNCRGWFVMGKAMSMVVKGIEELTPIDKREFQRRYAELQKYDFVYMDPNSNVIFSHAVVKDGDRIFRPIPSHRERIRAQFVIDAATMRERDANRVQMQQASSRGVESLQPAQQEFPTDRRAPSESQGTYSSQPAVSVPAYPDPDRRQSEDEGYAGDGHFLFGYESSAPVSTPTYFSGPGTGGTAPGRPKIQSQFF